MSRKVFRVVPALALLAVALVWVTHTPTVSGQGYTPSAKNGDWLMYTADIRGSKYSPLDQINGSNFSKLQLAWSFKTDHFGPRPEYWRGDQREARSPSSMR